jgi:hypothetical protein
MYSFYNLQNRMEPSFERDHLDPGSRPDRLREWKPDNIGR